MMTSFKDQETLTEWLIINEIDFSNWGRGNSKTIDDLWQEYVRGESSFEEDPPRRVVEVVQIIISTREKILLEVAQEFVDGRRRHRNRPPSDKIKPGENIQDAGLRCLQEELALKAGQIRFDPDFYKKKERILDSPSYPGLSGRYTLHQVKASVTGLPDGPFWRENSAAGKGDPVKRHLWDWVPLK